MFTSGYELSTAITNVFIFAFSVYGYFKIKDKKLWKFFFLTMIIDSFLGSIVHGIVMEEFYINIIWVFLAFFFTLTVNTLLCICLDLKYKNIFFLSILLSILMFSQMVYGFDYLFTFTMYALLVLAICTYYILKSRKDNYIWILIGFVFQVIGGILLLYKVKTNFMYLNHNGIYHLFMLVTLIFMFIGVNKGFSLEDSYE